MLREESFLSYLRDVRLAYIWPLPVLHVKHVAVAHAQCSNVAKHLQIFPSSKKIQSMEENFTSVNGASYHLKYLYLYNHMVSSTYFGSNGKCHYVSFIGNVGCSTFGTTMD